MIRIDLARFGVHIHGIVLMILTILEFPLCPVGKIQFRVPFSLPVKHTKISF